MAERQKLFDLIDEWDRTRSNLNTNRAKRVVAAPDERIATQNAALENLPLDVLLVVAQQLSHTPHTRATGQTHTGPVPRTQSLHIQADGLKSITRLGLVCRRLKTVHDELLISRPDLAQQAAEQSHVIVEKHRLVRRLTLDQHNSVVHKEVAFEVAGGSVLVTVLLAMCSSQTWCANEQLAYNAVAVAIVHTVMHNVLLRLAYRFCARYGILRTLVLGLLAASCLCLVLIPLWSTDGGASHTHMLPVLFLMLAWAYGAWEYRTAHIYLKSYNGLP